MSIDPKTQPAELAAQPSPVGGPPSVVRGRPGPAGRPWWLWAAPFIALAAVLIARNSFLFSHKLYEQADMAANSILIEQARHFSLLVGNYSREEFNHPGPAFLYVEAGGEQLFWSWLHLVPTPMNGQLLGVYLLDSAALTSVVAVVYGWTKSFRTAAVSFAVICGFIIVNPAVMNSNWMPYLYTPMFIAFVVATASVAAGARRDVWIMTLTGWFLIHGHAAYLLIVPALLAAALVLVLLRFGVRAPLRVFGQWRTWVPVAVISALFALPIVVNLAERWPGQFPLYFHYTSQSGTLGPNTNTQGSHTAGQIAQYVLWFWWSGRNPWLAPAVGYLVAIAVTVWLVNGRVRRFLAALLIINVASTVVFVAYASAGIDDFTQHYIGYFYWSAPVITLVVIGAALAQAMPPRVGAVGAGLVAATALLALAIVPGTRSNLNRVNPGTASGPVTNPALPAAVDTLAAQSAGKVIVVHVDHNSWPDMTGFLVQAERSGVTACVDDPWWTFMLTSQLICTPDQIATGARYWFHFASAPRGEPVLARLHATLITAIPPGTSVPIGSPVAVGT